MVSVRWKRDLALVFAVLFLSPTVQPIELLSKLENGTARRNHTILSSGAARYLKEAMPDYRPVSSADYDAFWFDPTSTSQTSAFDVSWFNWIIRGDFDGNRWYDYGLLMRGEIGGETRTALVVVRESGDGWTHDILESYVSMSSVSSAIQVVPPASIPWGLRKIRIRKLR